MLPILAQQADTNGIVAVGWLALAYLLHTTGELCLSPVGLSMVTKLSIPRLVGLMMGVVLVERVLALRRGSDCRGRQRIGDPGRGGRRWVDSLAIYVATFGSLAWIAVAVGVVVLALSPLVRRFMHESA